MAFRRRALPYKHTQTHTDKHTQTHTHTHKHTQTNTNRHTQTHTNTHRHTHMYSRARLIRKRRSKDTVCLRFFRNYEIVCPAQSAVKCSLHTYIHLSLYI